LIPPRPVNPQGNIKRFAARRLRRDRLRLGWDRREFRGAIILRVHRGQGQRRQADDDESETWKGRNDSLRSHKDEDAL
jgi:hypothetical protein